MNDGDIQRQINKDVWIPFLAASGAFDTNSFFSVQSKDIIRISTDSKEIYGLDRYQKEISDGFERVRERGFVRKSEMRFLERRATDNLAYETGYFRSHVTLPNGENRVRYVRFEIILRKEAGKWKILVDKDTTENGAITEEDFQRAIPMVHPEV